MKRICGNDVLEIESSRITYDRGNIANSSNICDFLNRKKIYMMIEIMPRDLKKGLRRIAETIE